MEKSVRLLTAAGILMLLAGGAFGGYPAMGLRGAALDRCVQMPDRGAELQKAEKRRIMRKPK